MSRLRCSDKHLPSGITSRDSVHFDQLDGSCVLPERLLGLVPRIVPAYALLCCFTAPWDRPTEYLQGRKSWATIRVLPEAGRLLLEDSADSGTSGCTYPCIHEHIISRMTPDVAYVRDRRCLLVMNGHCRFVNCFVPRVLTCTVPDCHLELSQKYTAQHM